MNSDLLEALMEVDVYGTDVLINYHDDFKLLEIVYRKLELEMDGDSLRSFNVIFQDTLYFDMSAMHIERKSNPEINSKSCNGFLKINSAVIQLNEISECEFNLQIYNSTGMLIYRKENLTENTNLDVEISSGIYIIQLQNKQGFQIKSIKVVL